MNNQPTLDEIDTFMANQPGWNEIGLTATHRITMDIKGRLATVTTYWNDWRNFTINYVKWVNKHIGGHCPNTVEMWEQWGKMLRELYLGIGD